MEKKLQAYHVLNRFFQSFIDHVRVLTGLCGLHFGGGYECIRVPFVRMSSQINIYSVSCGTWCTCKPMICFSFTSYEYLLVNLADFLIV